VKVTIKDTPERLAARAERIAAITFPGVLVWTRGLRAAESHIINNLDDLAEFATLRLTEMHARSTARQPFDSLEAYVTEQTNGEYTLEQVKARVAVLEAKAAKRGRFHVREELEFWSDFLRDANRLYNDHQWRAALWERTEELLASGVPNIDAYHYLYEWYMRSETHKLNLIPIVNPS
jgi:hypothetical protein